MITQDYTTFFKGLEKNNNKEWFHDHKKDYENHVKAPFVNLLESLIPSIVKLEPQISLQAKDALFRINKDIRFSKDKTPYHTLLKAGFASGGKKSMLPGFYLGISADTIHAGGGLFNVKGPELKKIRSLIADETDEFLAIVSNKEFENTFGGLKGEQAKRVDKTFEDILAKTPYILNKQFYAMAESPLSDYYDSKKLVAHIQKHFEVISKLNKFLGKAF